MSSVRSADDDFLERAAADRGLDAFLDDRRQAQLGDVFVRADRPIVLRRIDDPPVHEVVDDQVLLLAGQKTLLASPRRRSALGSDSERRSRRTGS